MEDIWPSLRRRMSRDFPPDLSELMNTLIKHASSFIREFDSREPKMRQIVRQFWEIADEVRTRETVTGRIVAFVASFTGRAGVFGVNVTKTIKEKVEELGKEFMEIIEPLKNDLREIKTTCEKLEERSAGDQAGITLTDMEELQRTLRRVIELAERSEEVLSFTATLMGVIQGFILLFVNLFRVTATPEQVEKLIKSIIQSADRCQEVVVKFDQMKKELKDFTEK